MDKKAFVDFSILIPVVLGILSILGIGIVYLIGRNNDERAPLPVTPTETPFRFVYLGTEPGLSTLTPEVTDTPEATPSSIPLPIITLAPTENDGDVTSLITPTQRVIPTATPTITLTLVSVLSKIDDTYFELLYDGNWTAQSDVSGAYQETLHISFSTGSSVEYTFVGQQIIVSYQAGPSLGTISINLDGLIVEVDQSSTQTEIVNWNSPVLVYGTHTLVMEHLSGGSINLDSITIPNLATATPTATPSVTPAP